MFVRTLPPQTPHVDPDRVRLCLRQRPERKLKLLRGRLRPVEAAQPRMQELMGPRRQAERAEGGAAGVGGGGDDGGAAALVDGDVEAGGGRGQRGGGVE